jgi:hypothetical protein
VSISNEFNALAGTSQWHQASEYSLRGANIAAPGRSLGTALQTFQLVRRYLARSPMWSRVDAVDKPRIGSDRSGDAHGKVLGELKRLEMVENYRFAETTAKTPKRPGQEKQRMPAESGTHSANGCM